MQTTLRRKERSLSNNELLGKSNVVTRNREKEKPFIVEAYSSAGMTEFTHGMKRKMVVQHEFLALMNERDTLFTANHYHMPLMLTSGRASALVQVGEPGNGLAAGRILARGYAPRIRELRKREVRKTNLGFVTAETMQLCLN